MRSSVRRIYQSYKISFILFKPKLALDSMTMYNVQGYVDYFQLFDRFLRYSFLYENRMFTSNLVVKLNGTVHAQMMSTRAFLLFLKELVKLTSGGNPIKEIKS